MDFLWTYNIMKSSFAMTYSHLKYIFQKERGEYMSLYFVLPGPDLFAETPTQDMTTVSC